MSANEKSCLRTFKLWLEPDIDFPRFKRLKWKIVEVPIQDVLMKGIHPWAEATDGNFDKHPSLVDAFLMKLNSDASKVDAFESFGYCYDVSAMPAYYFERQSRFERALENIRKNVCFVDELSYLDLLDIAKNHLSDTWFNSTARSLAERMCPGFQKLRQFLKSKDKSVRLSGFEDINKYDLSDVLSLDDFEGHDKLIISEAIPSLNFRKVSFLEKVIDGQGRLKIVPEISKVTMTLMPAPPDYDNLVLRVECDGDVCRFRPEIGKSEAKRAKAGEFANQWRTDDGRLCFSTNMDRLVQMVEERAVLPSFPTLNYTYPQSGPTATAEVEISRVAAYHIGRFRNHQNTGEELKEVLREYEVSMTGNKAALLKKLAKLAASQCREHRTEMDAFFSEHRYVRVNATPPKTKKFPILEDVSYLHNLLLSMYVIKHLRGNAILEASHENDTYNEEQLALALITGKVILNGTFLCVV